MFATLILEQAYPSFADLAMMAQSWLFIVGGIGIVMATLFLVRDGIRWARGKQGTYLLEGFAGRLPGVDPEARIWRQRTFWLFHVVAFLGVVGMISASRWVVENNFTRFEPRPWYYYSKLIASAGGLAILMWEFVLDLFQLSIRRVWAIARLSIKEAIRRKVLLGFLALIALFLFASWFVRADQRQNQWRTYVNLVYFVMSVLLLLTAATLSCFSLPADIRNQTIHTIVTKPVQKFEIILGRFLGFGFLMTIVLLVVATASLLYVVREIDPKAREETMRARAFVKGSLKFEQLDERGVPVLLERGENIGRSWEYRQYIRGGSTQTAVWRFAKVPANLKGLKQIPVEFSFDIYRMSKGGKIAEQGVQAQFSVRNTGNPRLLEYLQKEPLVNEKTKEPYTDEEKAKEFGYYQLKKPKVFDERSADQFEFPAELLEGVENGFLEIRVNCLSPGQYLGMAQYDLFIRSSEDNFYLNYFKGAMGIWFLMMLVIGIGVVLSTYLSALIALLTTALLMLCGIPQIRNFIFVMSLPPEFNLNPGGGPFEAMYRLFREENLTKKLERTRGVEVVESFDSGIRFFFSLLHSILPNLHQYNRTIFVAEGFSIPGADLAFNCVVLAGYLFPFFLLGYYLLNGREVAGAT